MVVNFNQLTEEQRARAEKCWDAVYCDILYVFAKKFGFALNAIRGYEHLPENFNEVFYKTCPNIDRNTVVFFAKPNFNENGYIGHIGFLKGVYLDITPIYHDTGVVAVTVTDPMNKKFKISYVFMPEYISDDNELGLAMLNDGKTSMRELYNVMEAGLIFELPFNAESTEPVEEVEEVEESVEEPESIFPDDFDSINEYKGVVASVKNKWRACLTLVGKCIAKKPNGVINRALFNRSHYHKYGSW